MIPASPQGHLFAQGPAPRIVEPPRLCTTLPTSVHGKIAATLSGNQTSHPPTAHTGFIYVGLIAVPSLAAWGALTAGLSPGAVLLGISVIVALLVAACERIWPYQRAWLLNHGDLRTDALHLLFTGLLTAGGRWSTTLVLGALATFGLAGGAGGVSLSIWPTTWPILGQLALALVVQDFCGYWVHRSQHVIPLLWRFHAVHHSAPRLYWLNQTRNHPIDALVSGASMIPVAAAGAPESTLALFGVLSTAHLVLQHANIDYRLGAFARWLSAAQAHRWHHSRRLDESNGNYGSILLVWDALFRTRVWPTDHPPPVDTGLTDRDDFPTGYWGQLVVPFRRPSVGGAPTDQRA